MRPSFSMFMLLPLPVRAAILVCSGGGIVMLIMMLSGMNIFGTYGYMILVVLAAIAFAGAAFGFVTSRLEKRKSKPFERKLAENAAAAPQGVADPGSRAKLDDLRKKFDEGIQVFKDHGKDLYTMPWYVMVGEPGSGKTEAMRHSNVGFPPGLQNQLQGVGGTVNMHWWFTMDAVIIDTAGRLMFEEVEPGQTSEWTEFLKMLRQARPNCPLNGMLLVIPADSLIKDTANDIDRKGGKIAQQLDQIQRALGVRFPVFVLITKADRINGFREFFDELTDPIAAMQMMGWSNPKDLDTPFDPSLVEQHLRAVRDRLIRRRFALLSNPVHTEDPIGRRIDQVDALYAFPDSLLKLAPRLRRYLEMIFVVGEWSQKPLFLRGIYFTSSMRENDALDADLAEALGVQVDALPEGKLWAVDRSFFLKDVFKEKVFRERGLVTRESNVGKSRRRQSIIMAGGIAVAAALIGIGTFFSARQLDANIKNESDFWTSVDAWLKDNANAKSIDVGQRQVSEYRDGNVNWLPTNLSWTIDGVEFRKPASTVNALVDDRVNNRVAIHRSAWHWATHDRKTPLVFKLAAAGTGVGDSAKRVQRAMFEAIELQPYISDARRRITMVREWNEPSLAALRALVEIQVAGLPGAPLPDKEQFARWLNALGYSGKSADIPFAGEPTKLKEGAGDEPTPRYEGDHHEFWDAFKAGDHAGRLAEIMAGMYGPDGTEGREGFRRAFGLEEGDAFRVVEEACEAFLKSWEADTGTESGLLAQLRTFNRLAGEFEVVEQQVFDAIGNPSTVDEFVRQRDRWVGLVDELERKRRAMDDLLQDAPGTAQARLRRAIIEFPADDRLRDAVIADENTRIEKGFSGLLDAIPLGLKERELSDEQAREAEQLSALRERLASARKALEAGVAKQVEDATRGETESRRRKLLVGDPKSKNEFEYARRFALLKKVRDVISDEPSVALGGAGAARTPVDQVKLLTFASWVKAFSGSLESLGRTQESAASGCESAWDAARTACQRAVSAYGRYGKTRAFGQAVTDVKSFRTLEDLAASRGADEAGAGPLWEQAAPAMLDSTQLALRVASGFAITPAKAVFDAERELAELWKQRQGALLESSELSQEYEAALTLISTYRQDYVKYWTQTIPSGFAVNAGQNPDWASLWKRVHESRAGDDCAALRTVTERVLRALDAIDSTQDAKVAQWKNALSSDLIGLDRDGKLRKDALEVRGRFDELTQDASAALRKIREDRRSMNAEEFEDAYLATCMQESDLATPARVYWDSFVTTNLKALRRVAQGQADADWLLLAGAKGIPLARGTTNQLSVEQVRSALEAAVRLSQASSAASGAGAGASELRVRAEVRAIMDEVEGRSKKSRSEQEWIEKVAAIARALATREPQSAFEIAFRFPMEFGGSGEVAENARLQAKAYSIRASGAISKASDIVARGSDTFELTFPSRSGEALELALYEEPAQMPAQRLVAKASIAGPWHLLGLWLSSPQAPVLSNGEYLVKVPTTTGDSFYLAVKLPEGLPTWDQWPRADEWPAGE